MVSSYREMANRMRIDLCEGPCEWGDLERHWKGGASRGTVHWHRERVTRAGAYIFLKLCASLSLDRSLPVYQQIYEQSTYAVNNARVMGMVIPSTLTAHDRLRVRATLPEGTSTSPAARWAYKEAI